MGQPSIVDANCKKSKKFDLLCRVVLTTENSAIVQVQSGMINFTTQSYHFLDIAFLQIFFIIFSGPKTWIREESLASIAAIEILDLPLLDNEGAIEKQLKSRNGKKFLSI